MAEYNDGAHYEVQLNNKQLVFFFMATLAIAVVVFLCGVMVGRGVRDATLAVPGTDIAAGTLRQIPDSRRTVPAGTPKLDYAQRLEEEKPQAKPEPVRSTGPETTVSQDRFAADYRPEESPCAGCPGAGRSSTEKAPAVRPRQRRLHHSSGGRSRRRMRLGPFSHG